MFPDPDHNPAGGDELAIGSPITQCIAPDLLEPPRRIALHRLLVTPTPVPETSVNEYSHPSSNEDDVRITP